ncbi:MAG: hypothetical protein JWQ90_2482 [Hydrocarboniphaga sp.]|uniref:oxidoreductase n=1 Tax=Hydrocarboniphaga sp. TaxID=2033016 RepID=UPI0026225BB8|nr:oxidoreductase [Hydrocarboniphaga sp.]MDB5970032.1 hypothetical protein [Hydrocarboniphaga sp.]
MSWKPWDGPAIRDQCGRVAVITGANSGLGLQIASVLAQRGATVVLACRSEQRAQDAAAAIGEKTGSRTIETLQVDLGSLDSVRTAADVLARRHARIDLLINNAGIATPPFAVSAEGVESQMAVNHLGHFVWTALLLGSLLKAPGSRVVGISSLAYHVAHDIPDDWRGGAANYQPFLAYARSKLAILLFTRALQLRLDRAGASTIAVAAHPGGARTDLIRSPMGGMKPSLAKSLLQFQSAEKGALPALRAALDPQAKGGEFFAPGGPMQLWGLPVRVRMPGRAGSPNLQDKLWRMSEQAANLQFPL